MLFAHSNLVIAIATIYRSASAGLKRYFRIFATLVTHYTECLTLGCVAIGIFPVAIAAVYRLLRFPCLAAGGAALGCVSMPYRVVKLLFVSAKSEAMPTIEALDCLVLITHWMTSTPCFSLGFGHPILRGNLRDLPKYAIT